MTLPVRAILHMLYEVGWPEYFKQTLGICVLLGIPMNIEISKDQQMSTTGDKKVNKREFAEEISSFQTIILSGM